MIRVIIADADNSFRSMLCDAIHGIGDIEIEAELGDAQKAIYLAADLNPDVFFLGVDVVSADHLSLLEQVVGVSLKTRLIMVAQSAEDWSVMEAFRIGLNGYAKKDKERMNELAEMIRTVSSGGSIITPHLTALIFDELCRGWRESKIAEKSHQRN